MKISLGTLRSLLNERAISRLLNEDDSLSHEKGESGDSLDSQVDRYLAEYEQSAKKADGSDSAEPSVDQMEAIDWRDLVKGTVLTEAGEGDKDEKDDESDAAPGADELTGQDNTKLGTESLDVEDFANSVVRLIDNYDSLLEIRSTLMRRAKTFLKKTYSDDVVKAFEDTLRDDHGMETGTDQMTTNADKFPAPAADRASGSAEPGPGGGGGA